MSDIGPMSSSFSTRQRNELRQMIDRAFRRLFTGTGDAAATALTVARNAAASVGAVVLDVNALRVRESYRRSVIRTVSNISVLGSGQRVTVTLTAPTLTSPLPGTDYAVQASVATTSGLSLSTLTVTPDLASRTTTTVDVILTNTGLAAISTAIVQVTTSPPALTTV